MLVTGFGCVRLALVVDRVSVFSRSVGVLVWWRVCLLMVLSMLMMPVSRWCCFFPIFTTLSAPILPDRAPHTISLSPALQQNTRNEKTPQDYEDDGPRSPVSSQGRSSRWSIGSANSPPIASAPRSVWVPGKDGQKSMRLVDFSLPPWAGVRTSCGCLSHTELIWGREGLAPTGGGGGGGWRPAWQPRWASGIR